MDRNSDSLSLSSKTHQAAADSADGSRYRPGYELAAERIEGLIAEQGLTPGDRLPTEQELAALLGVSRPVIRESLKLLSAAGRLSVRKGVGILVSDRADLVMPRAFDFFDPTDVAHVEWVFEFRVTQEAASARLAAARATPRHLQLLRESVAAADEGAAAGDIEVFGARDDDVHRIIAEASGNPFLLFAVEISRRLQRQAILIAAAGDPGRSLTRGAAEHHEILDALADGDGEQAAARMSAHIYDTLSAFRREMRRRAGG